MIMSQRTKFQNNLVRDICCPSKLCRPAQQQLPVDIFPTFSSPLSSRCCSSSMKIVGVIITFLLLLSTFLVLNGQGTRPDAAFC